MSTYIYFSSAAPDKTKSQYEIAQEIYSTRAKGYDDSWHPDYAARLMEHVAVQPADRVLVLACGTGLEAALAAPIVGAKGCVICLDATEEMLAVAQRKLTADPLLASRIRLIQHDVTALSSCKELQKGFFDVIICSNAFALFKDPGVVLSHWWDYLKHDGRLAIDIPHERSFFQGILVERVAKQLGIHYPVDRAWIESRYTLRRLLEQCRFTVETDVLMEKRPNEDVKYYDVMEADRQFDVVIKGPTSSQVFSSENLLHEARTRFRIAWANAAENGKVEVRESMYLYIARKV